MIDRFRNLLILTERFIFATAPFHSDMIGELQKIQTNAMGKDRNKTQCNIHKMSHDQDDHSEKQR